MDKRNVRISSKTVIIAAFPGCGKSRVTQELYDLGFAVSDSDSSSFSWIYKEDGTKERNPEFPLNYIRHIANMYAMGTVDFIFVSTHKEVLAALIDEQLPVWLVRPKSTLMEKYTENYRKRGSDEKFIELIRKNWFDFIMDIMTFSQFSLGCTVLSRDQYIADIVFQIRDAWNQEVEKLNAKLN